MSAADLAVAIMNISLADPRRDPEHFGDRLKGVQPQIALKEIVFLRVFIAMDFAEHAFVPEVLPEVRATIGQCTSEVVID